MKDVVVVWNMLWGLAKEEGVLIFFVNDKEVGWTEFLRDIWERYRFFSRVEASFRN